MIDISIDSNIEPTFFYPVSTTKRSRQLTIDSVEHFVRWRVFHSEKAIELGRLNRVFEISVQVGALDSPIFSISDAEDACKRKARGV